MLKCVMQERFIGTVESNCSVYKMSIRSAMSYGAE